MNTNITHTVHEEYNLASRSPRLGAGFTKTEIILLITFVSIIATWSLFGLVKTGREARDAERVSHIHIVRNRLEYFFVDKQEYPEGQMIAIGKDSRIKDCEGAPCTFLTDVGWAGTSAGEKIYLVNAPTDPRGPSEKCGQAGNTEPCIYTYSSDSQDTFRIFFYLEGTIDRLKGGNCIADKTGIRCDGA